MTDTSPTVTAAVRYKSARRCGAETRNAARIVTIAAQRRRSINRSLAALAMTRVV
ncbi:MAG: hypothetical protein JXB36_19505 [Gammaproteobacteria bacterium]|nr:hypothetical protein [Gammaproteobacteria bacterium]